MSESTGSAPVVDLGVKHLPDGLTVQLNPNQVTARVVRGDNGCILVVESCGISIGLALPEASVRHLVALMLPLRPASDAAVSGMSTGVSDSGAA